VFCVFWLLLCVSQQRFGRRFCAIVNAEDECESDDCNTIIKVSASIRTIERLQDVLQPVSLLAFTSQSSKE
jgi:hypothetical protein